jgi:uncharacterized protein YciI
MFVILLSYVKPIEEIDRLRPAHLQFLDRYYAKNIFIASGRQTPLKGGVILANAESRAAIEQIITEDPFYTEKAATFEIVEFTPNKVSPNVAALVAA